MSFRPVQRVTESQLTIEGAGVRLRRAFGFGETAPFDPYLLFDDFRGDRPDDYRTGFPWHPHRGIETVTYVLAGEVEHGDSRMRDAGNSLTAGDQLQPRSAARPTWHYGCPSNRRDRLAVSCIALLGMRAESQRYRQTVG